MQDIISIRKAESADIEVIKTIEIECGLSVWSKTDYEHELLRSDSLFFIVEINTEIAGFLLARLIMNEQILSLKNEIEIYNIAVKKNFRNKKAGSRLLNKLFERTDSKDISKIHLEVRKSNIQALSFYQKNGFEVIGERRNFYTNPSEDALLMCRILDD